MAFLTFILDCQNEQAKKAECKFIEGDTQTAVQELVRLLREEAKVI